MQTAEPDQSSQNKSGLGLHFLPFFHNTLDLYQNFQIMVVNTLGNNVNPDEMLLSNSCLQSPLYICLIAY